MHLFRQLSLVIVIKLGMLFGIATLAAGWFSFQAQTFSFPEVIGEMRLPEWLKVLAYFDGIHYITIAQHGYYEFGHAFFPLYPGLLAALSDLGLNWLVMGVVLSHLFWVASLVLLQQLIALLKIKASFWWLVLFILAFPTAFFFQAVYTESLFLLLTVLTFWGVGKQRWSMVCCSAFLASLTRVNGVLLFLPLAMIAFQLVKKHNHLRWWLLPLFPLLGLGIYMIYLLMTTGDGFAFVHAQAAFGAGRSTQLVVLPQVYWRYLKIFLDFNLSFAYWRSWLELGAFTMAAIVTTWFCWQAWVKKQWLTFELGIFCGTSLLLPTLTGTFLSMPRFVIVCLPLFFWLASLESRVLKSTLLVGLAGLQVVLFALFSRGYFIS